MAPAGCVILLKGAFVDGHPDVLNVSGVVRSSRSNSWASRFCKTLAWMSCDHTGLLLILLASLISTAITQSRVLLLLSSECPRQHAMLLQQPEPAQYLENLP